MSPDFLVSVIILLIGIAVLTVVPSFVSRLNEKKRERHRHLDDDQAFENTDEEESQQPAEEELGATSEREVNEVGESATSEIQDPVELAKAQWQRQALRRAELVEAISQVPEMDRPSPPMELEEDEG